MINLQPNIPLNIFSAEKGSPVTLFIGGVAFTEINLVCPCGHVRSDVNRLPADSCPVCSSNQVIPKLRLN